MKRLLVVLALLSSSVAMAQLEVMVTGVDQDGNTQRLQLNSLGQGTMVVDGGVSVTNFPASYPVTGTFWQTTQPVSGTFWQATQPVSGTVSATQGTSPWVTSGTATVTQGTSRDGGYDWGVNVDNFPASYPVTGTFWQTTQPVSQGVGADAGTAWDVAGTVSVNNFPATQPVSGTFWQATQPVSGTFWQATQPVSGTVGVNNFPASQAVTGTFWQATQPVSGSVSVSGTATVTQGTSRDGGYNWGVNVDNPTADAGPLSLDSNGALRVSLDTLIAGENIDGGYQYVNTAAQQSCVTAEVLVLGDAGVSTMPATALVGRRSVEVQNNGGPDAGQFISCQAGSSAAGGYVRRIAAGASWSLDVVDTIIIRCRQSSGDDQTTGNGAAVTECK